MPDLIRLLHLEDNPRDADLILAKLHNDGLRHEATVVATREAFMTALDEGDFDLILSDYNLPGFDGIAALSLAQERCPTVPFIFVTGTMGEDIAVCTLRLGATDYILKDNLERLPSAVDRALRDADIAEKRRQMEVELRDTNELLSSLIRSMPVAIIALDLSGHVTLWNPEAERLFGWRADEVLGRPLPIVPSDKREEHREFVDRILRGERFADIKVIRQMKAGTRVAVSLSTVPLRNASGTLCGILDIMDGYHAGK